MASIVLSKAGSALGTSLLGNQIGASLGQTAGGFIGQALDRAIGGLNNKKHTQSGQINELSIQQSAYGQMIPVVYGVVKLNGNIIWVSKLQEHKATISDTIGGKGSGMQHLHTDYVYSISLAIALCEGPINAIQRVWADEQPFDVHRHQVRIYLGDEEQLPDPLIESIQGIGKTPAYRGLAYVVIENLELAVFGNRIPFFSFEVQRIVKHSGVCERAEDMVRSVIIIPGSGEFVYDTTTQYRKDGDHDNGDFVRRGPVMPINKHTMYTKTNALVALDDMNNTLPNLEWVAPVVGWFGTGLDIGQCSIKPGVEYHNDSITAPDEWKVAGYTRSNAHLITQANGRPIYGGTTSDAALERFLLELKGRDYKIMLYPILFIDTIEKPWRGRMYGSSFSISSFFHKADGYKNFILHYAKLAKGKVDAFVIGSEMVGLNQIAGIFYAFPAIDYWLELAKEVKLILGADTYVTYAADWSEYHHTKGGWHHLDPLWASPYIDVVGIDAYFPLTEGKAFGSHAFDDIIKGWDSGEGYDYHYSDLDRSEKIALEPRYAWKNLQWWWENYHVNPDGSTTAWRPKSKKIWFTEYGFPSVDCATNQPNVFWSDDSIESHLPRDSEGHVNLLAQRLAITATEMRWQNSEMVERKFLWTWDARPFPFWPDLSEVWNDGACWYRGHWVQGKLGALSLAQIVADLCQRSGLSTNEIDVTALHDVVEGVLINRQTTPRIVLEALQQSYFFDITISNGVLLCVPRQQKSVTTLTAEHLLPLSNSAAHFDILQTKISPEIELPQQTVVNFIDRYSNYEIGSRHAQHHFTTSKVRHTINLPIVLQPERAELVAEVSLLVSWLERTHYSLALPPKYMYLIPGDVLRIAAGGGVPTEVVIRITNIYLNKDRCVLIEGVAENMSIYQNSITNPLFCFNPILDRTPNKTHFEVLDLPLLANEELYGDNSRVMLAACGVGDNWKGALIQGDLHQPGCFQSLCSIKRPAVIGMVLGKLWPINNPCIMDRISRLYVNILGGKLQGVTAEELATGANTAVVGEEIIQFQYAKLVKPYQYELSNLLRGRYGTELKARHHKLHERFVLLDESIVAVPLSSSYRGQIFTIKAIDLGLSTPSSAESSSTQSFTYEANALLPFAPVHLLAKATAMHTLTVQWYRRSRISNRANNSWSRGAAQWENADRTTLAEEKEQYQLMIYHNGIVVHSVECTHSEYRLNAKDWEKYGLPLVWDELIIQVAQISTKVGAGPYTIVKLDKHGNPIYHEDSL